MWENGNSLASYQGLGPRRGGGGARRPHSHFPDQRRRERRNLSPLSPLPFSSGIEFPFRPLFLCSLSKTLNPLPFSGGRAAQMTFCVSPNRPAGDRKALLFLLLPPFSLKKSHFLLFSSFCALRARSFSPPPWITLGEEEGRREATIKLPK